MSKKNHEGPTLDMEKLLRPWVEDQLQKHISLSTMAKAKTFFAILKEKSGHDFNVEFTTSSGWFKGFMNHCSSHNAKASGGSVSADVKVAKKIMKTLEKQTVKENYLPEEINMDRTFLFWKWISERTFIYKKVKSMSVFKAFKNRIKVSLRINVAGYKLKPFVILVSENLSAFRHINKQTTPVYYRSNKKS